MQLTDLGRGVQPGRFCSDGLEYVLLRHRERSRAVSISITKLGWLDCRSIPSSGKVVLIVGRMPANPRCKQGLVPSQALGRSLQESFSGSASMTVSDTCVLSARAYFQSNVCRQPMEISSHHSVYARTGFVKGQTVFLLKRSRIADTVL